MKEPSPNRDFRVIIVGGGLAGLALGSALDRAGIDFILLEARDVIDPAVGASMGFMANGLRILDQLGCYDDIASLSYGIKKVGNHDQSGALIQPRDDSPELGQQRVGYEAVFLDRRLVLQVLYNHLASKSKILTGKRLRSIDHSSQGATAHCEDGTSYQGDIIAGADGTYSVVRQQMWQAADLAEPGFISKDEKQLLTAEYQVLFGISTATTGLYAGNYDVTYMKGVSAMVIIGKDNVVYWFLFKKLDRVYRVGEIPRYSKAEAEAFAYSTLIATEEASYKHWTWGRFACIGDSVHKVTPNAGVGGNASFESAAALANSIKSLLDSSQGKPSFELVKTHLKQFETSRIQHAMEISKIANGVTRLQALSNYVERFIVFFVSPNAGDLLIDMMSDLFIGATKIDFLPPPELSIKSTMPFNTDQGIAKKEKIWYRLLLALPFIALSIGAYRCMSAGNGLEGLGEILESSTIAWDEYFISLPKYFYYVTSIDNIFRPITILFASSSFGIDPVAWWQMLTFITDLGVLVSIMLIESTRRSNTLTICQVPLLFLLAAQLWGIGLVAPLYFGLHYVSSQMENFKATDHRLTNLAYTSTVLPVLVVGFYAPHFIAYFYPDFETRYTAIWIWQLYPVWLSISQALLAKTIVPDTIQQDRIHAPLRDLPIIRYTIGTCIALAGAVWLYTMIKSPYSMSTILIPSWNVSQTSWIDCARHVLQYDYIFCWMSALLWIGYLFTDLKHAGMITQSWTRISVTGVLVMLALGPGAVLGLGWLWREQVIATRRHKSAITKV